MKKLLATVAMMVSTLSVNAQSPFPSVGTSPQAEAFKKYGGYEVSLSTGAPDISIPLFDIDHYGYQIPVSLNYVAQPIKPGYNYDVFGLGWSLSTRGVISRSIEYIPDEWSDFQLQQPPSFNYFLGSSWATDYNYAYDKFNAVLPDGTVFDFTIKKQGGVYAVISPEAPHVKISFVSNTLQISSFTVVDAKGVKYFFEGADTPRAGGQPSPYLGTYVSWLLTRIDLPNSPTPILFSYDLLLSTPSQTCYDTKLTVGDYHRGQDPSGVNPPHVYTHQRSYNGAFYAYDMRLLTLISYGNTTIRLHYKNPNGAYRNYITRLEIKEDETIVREVAFTTTGNGGQAEGCYGTLVSNLDKVEIKGGGASPSVQTYACTYSAIITGSGTDHWGYVNYTGTDMPGFNFFMECDMGNAGGVITQVSKDPGEVNPYYKYKLSSYGNFYPDCREAGAPYQHGVLQRITYPTGGYTNFEFENHQFLTSTDNNGNYIFNPANRVLKNAAGFRIKTIASYAADGAIADTKCYRYGADNSSPTAWPPGTISHTGLGQAVVDPNILTYASYTSYASNWNTTHLNTRFMLLGQDEQGQQPVWGFTNPYTETLGLGGEIWEWECVFSPVHFRNLLGGRPPVVYSEVTVYDGDLSSVNYNDLKGKTVYKYAIEDLESNQDFFETFDYVTTGSGHERLLSFPKSYLYNRLMEKTSYRTDVQQQTFVPIKRDVNQWTWGEYANDAYIQVYSLPSQMSQYPENQHTSTFNGTYNVTNLFAVRHFTFGYKQMSQTTTTEYDMSGDSLVRGEYYNYNSQNQLVFKAVTDRYDWFSYFDYKHAHESPLLDPLIKQDMIDRNLIGPVVLSTKEIERLRGTSDFTLVEGTRTDYAKFGSSQIIMPSKYYELYPSSSGTQYRLRNEITSYSENGNPLEIISDGNFYTSFKWGYNDRYMTAEIKNAKAGETFLNNFEDRTGWDGGLTVYDNAQSRTGSVSGRIDKAGAGKQAAHSTQWLSIALSSSKKFRYSGWVYSNGPSADIFLLMKRNGETGYYSYADNITTTQPGQWVYLEKEFLVPADVTQLNMRLDNNGGGSVWFDDIRLYPADAVMTSYTHEPLVGITSQTGADGRPVTYNYDGLGRLSLVRDHEGNIISKYCYTLSGEQYQCDENSTVVFRTTPAPLWKTTGKQRCETGVSGNNTGYLQKEFLDQNTASSGFKSSNWLTMGFDLRACPLNQVFTKIVYSNIMAVGEKYYADVELRFYKDPNAAMPASVNDLQVMYSRTDPVLENSQNETGNRTKMVSVAANGHIMILARHALVGGEAAGQWLYQPASKKEQAGRWVKTGNGISSAHLFNLVEGNGYGIIH